MTPRNHVPRIPLRRWAAALALACLSLNAAAVTWNSRSDFYWNAQTGKIDVFAGQGSGNIWSSGNLQSTANGASWSKNKALPFNPSPTATFKANFTPAAMAKGFATGAAIPLAAAVIQSLLTEVCVRAVGGQMVSNGSWEECVRGPNKTIVVYQAVNSGRPSPVPGMGYFETKEEARAAWIAYKNDDQPPGGTCNAQQGYKWGPYQIINPSTNGGNGFTYGRACGPLNPSSEAGMYFTANRTVPGDPIGWQATTQGAVESKAADKLDEWTQADFSYGLSRTKDFLDEIIKGGAEVDFTISVDPIAPIQSPPRTETITTTDSNNNTVETTRTTTTNNTYSITNNNTTNVTITHNQTSTSVTNHPDGSTTTETSDETKDPEEKPNDCDPAGDWARCSKLDTPEVDMPSREENVAWEPMDLGFSTGTCPAPITWTDSLGTHAIQFTQICDVMSTIIRPLVLLMAALAAAFIVLPRET